MLAKLIPKSLGRPLPMMKMMRPYFCLFFVACTPPVIPSPSGTGPQGSSDAIVDEESFATAYAKARCAGLIACCKAHDDPVDQTACEDTARKRILGYVYQTEGAGLSFDVSVAEACVKEMALSVKAACGAGTKYSANTCSWTAPALGGGPAHKKGERCYDNQKCEPGLICSDQPGIFSCVATKIVGVGEACDTSYNQGFDQFDYARCKPGLFCQLPANSNERNKGTCAEPLADGALCPRDHDDVCIADHHCRGSTRSMHCAPDVAIGDSCANGEWCEKAAYCSEATKLCTALAPLGAPCGNGAYCKHDLACSAGKCVTPEEAYYASAKGECTGAMSPP